MVESDRDGRIPGLAEVDTKIAVHRMQTRLFPPKLESGRKA